MDIEGKRQISLKKKDRPTNDHPKLNNNHKIALCGVLIALAMILSYLESLVPIHMAVPGVKLGLANLVTIIALQKLDLRATVVISVGRIILSNVLFGNMAVLLCGMQHPDHDGTKKMPGIRTCRNQRRRRSLPQSGADPGRGLRDGKRAYFLLYVHPVDYRNGRWCSNRIACFVSVKKYKNIVTKVVKLRTHLLIKILTCIRIVVNIF
mgnify:CR=1 FL=1